MITYQEDTVTSIADEGAYLIHDHWLELEESYGHAPDPDYDSYLKLEEMGVIKAFSVRDKGEMVGYATFMMTPHLHYKSVPYAINDMLFIKKSYRGRAIGSDFIKYIESNLRDNNTTIISINSKVATPLNRLLDKLDYTHTENVYRKNIGK